MNLKENCYLPYPSASVTIITVVRNTEKFIGEAILSVIQQSYKDWQYIIVDDNSTDETRLVAERLALNNGRIAVWAQPKKNVNVHINNAISKISTDFVAFLDGDDVWQPTKLEEQLVNMTQTNSVADLCSLEEFGESTDGKFKAREGVLPGFGRTTFICKTSLFDEVGAFDEDLEHGEFIEWYNRVTRKELLVSKIETPLALRRVHDNNITRQLKHKDYLTVLRRHLQAKKEAFSKE